MNQNDNWNLKDIFVSKEAFEDCKKSLRGILEEIKKYQGNLGKSSRHLYECYSLYEKGLECLEKIYAFGMLTYHLDMANQESIKLFKEVENIATNFSQGICFMMPEIMEIEESKLNDFMLETPALNRYKRALEDSLEKRKHILTKDEERLLSKYGEVFSASENTFDVLTNAEFKYGNLVDEKGNEVEMTDGTYTKFLRSKEERVRREAFDLMYDQYSRFRNTMTELYLAKVKEYTITSKLRNYQSSLERAVLQDDASILVYEKLIESVHKNLNVNHAFMRLKKRMLGGRSNAFV